jgi:hypothetical protein
MTWKQILDRAEIHSASHGDDSDRIDQNEPDEPEIAARYDPDMTRLELSLLGIKLLQQLGQGSMASAYLATVKTGGGEKLVVAKVSHATIQKACEVFAYEGGIGGMYE